MTLWTSQGRIVGLILVLISLPVASVLGQAPQSNPAQPWSSR